MKLTNLDFRGSWAGLPVAWTADDQFDEQIYRGDVARCCRIGAPGVYTGGTTGEFYAMEFDEFKRIARATVEEGHANGKPVLIGVTSTYTLGAVRRAAYAAEVGADAVQVALPFWMEVPNDSVMEFFKEVARASKGLAISIYETLRAKKALTFEQHRAIKSEIPSYVMVKANSDTIGTTKEGCAALTKLGISVFTDEGSLYPVLGPYGVAGACSSLVYYIPDQILALNRDLQDKNWAQLAQRAVVVNKLLDFLTVQFDARGLLDSAVDRLGGVASGILHSNLYCRPPYKHATQEDLKALREWFRDNIPEAYSKIETNLALP